MNWKLVVKIAGYVALALLVGFVLFGSFQYYFRKKTPNVQNFAAESKPVFNTTTTNMEYHWSVGPYIGITYVKEAGLECGLRLEYRF